MGAARIFGGGATGFSTGIGGRASGASGPVEPGAFISRGGGGGGFTFPFAAAFGGVGAGTVLVAAGLAAAAGFAAGAGLAAGAAFAAGAPLAAGFSTALAGAGAAFAFA